MKLYQITVRNRVTGRCVQSMEVYAENQKQAIKSAIGFYPEYAASPAVYRVNVKVLSRGFTELRRIIRRIK